MNEEERRKIYINNLSKIKKRTGRPKKNGKRITVRYDPAVFMAITRYAETMKQSTDLTINEILLNFLKPKVERTINNIPQYYFQTTYKVSIGKKS